MDALSGLVTRFLVQKRVELAPDIFVDVWATLKGLGHGMEVTCAGGGGG